MIPANMRRVVVFPAPSVPTRPKISPACTSKLSALTARTPGKLLVSPSATMAGSRTVLAGQDLAVSMAGGADAGRGQLDVRVGGHAGLELVVGIVDVDLDAIDERDALLVVCTLLGVNSASGEMKEMRPWYCLPG